MRASDLPTRPVAELSAYAANSTITAGGRRRLMGGDFGFGMAV